MRNFYCMGDALKKYVETVYKRDCFYPDGFGCKARARHSYYNIVHSSKCYHKDDEFLLFLLPDGDVLVNEEPNYWR